MRQQSESETLNAQLTFTGRAKLEGLVVMQPFDPARRAGCIRNNLMHFENFQPEQPANGVRQN